MKIFKSELLSEEYSLVNHPSGLKIYVFPKKNYNTSYAIIGTKYGSINRVFKLGGKLIETPSGIAHFLEHKLFECKEGDAFTLFSKTGASANAYTSFDKTAYLFSCSENFKESLKILMNFVQEPYFTEQGIQKERGIIEQEIKMYDDSPEWKVTINLLSAIYKNHPVRYDIAGSVESISHITTDLMNKCYEAFYRFSNMTMCLVGNFEKDDILSFLDKLIINKDHNEDVENIFPDESSHINSDYVEEKMEVINPLFSIGFKHDLKGNISCDDFIKYNLILKMMCLKSGDLYSNLLSKGLITTNSFDYEFFNGPGYSSSHFSGESENPKEILNIIKNEMHELSNKISDDLFGRAKKCFYSDTVSIFDSPSAIANQLLSFDFMGFDIFDFIERISQISIEDIVSFLKDSYYSDPVLSIVNPIGK